MHKFDVASDGTLTEVAGSKGMPWYSSTNEVTADKLPSPHGLGRDLNGNFYIGETFSGQIRKLDCLGNIEPTTSFEVADGGFNITSIGNTIYVNSTQFSGIYSYDICTSANTGHVRLSSGVAGSYREGDDWGFYVAPDNTFYAAGGFARLGGNNLYVFNPTATDFTNNTEYSPVMSSSSSDPDPAIGTLGIMPRGDIRGVTTDANGFIYIVRLDNIDPLILCSRIYKYAPNTYELLAKSDEDCIEDGAGWNQAIEIVYSADCNCLYTSSQSFIDDCVHIFDTNLVSMGVGIGPVSATDRAKGIALSKECCPTSPNIVIDTILCNSSSIGQTFFLQNLINCSGSMCEGDWTLGGSNTGLTFDPCEKSVLITQANACGSFSLSSDGTATNNSCGAFSITVNFLLEDVTAATVAGDQTVCSGDDPAAFTVTTAATGSNTINYQWQSSTTDCNSGFTDIVGAISATYDPPVLTETTYYRAITSVGGTCTTNMCQDTSNCLTVTVNALSTATAAITDPTCTGLTVNNDGTIILSGFTTETYDMNTGNTYTGSATFATATAIPAGGVITNTLVNPTGSQDYTVRIFNSNGCYVDRTVALNETSCEPVCSSISNTEIKGTVWEDWNYDGTLNESDTIGVQGIQVLAYDCDNNLVSTTYTDANGNYQFTGLTTGEDYRIEFILPESVASWAKPTRAGANSGTTVQFVQPEDCASLGVASPADYCESNPLLVTPCFVNGEALGGTTTGGMDAFVGVPINFSGTGLVGSDNNYLANAEDIGATWGVAVQASTQTVFTSSVLKRHVSLGPDDTNPATSTHTTGGIYAIDYSNPATPSVALWLDLNTLSGINTGADPHSGLGGDPTAPYHDTDAFAAVGKISIGDLDISEDGTTLYAMNLNEKTLIVIDIASKTVVNQYTIPNPGCTNSDNTIIAAYNFTDAGVSIEGKGLTWASGLGLISGGGGNVTNGSLADFNPTSAPQNIFVDPIYGNNLSLPLAVGNGTYEVSLYFRDYGDGIGASVFDISLEGSVVGNNFDIEADNTSKWSYLNLNTTGGDNGDYDNFGWVANEQTYTVTVTDGTLNVNLDKVSGLSGLLSGIKVTDVNLSPNASTDYRPWGIGVNKDKIYIGVVCSGETSGLREDLTASVFELQGSSFSEILSFPLDYERGFTVRGPSNIEFPAHWQAWSDDNTYATWDGEYNATFAEVSHQQPILSDIDFDNEGNILLGLLDRSANQVGYENYTPTSGSTVLEYAFSGGDILKACNTSSGWVIEGDAACAQSFSGISSHLNYLGINGGEYFGEDYALTNSDVDIHDEVSWGGIMYFRSTDQLIITGMGPRNTINSGGIIWYDNANGQFDQGYEVYGDGSFPELFGKANGLGDIEFLCAAAPLEIGNYVWEDADNDGIQDACERGIDDIIVQLYDRTGVLVAQDTTVNGQYYFNQYNVDTTGITVDGSGIASPVTAWSGMSYSTQYFIVFGGGQFSTDEFTVGSDTYGITSMVNAGNNDNIDSDVDGSSLTAGSLGARPDGLPFIDMTTSATGCGDHKYDLGVICGAEYDWGDLPDTSANTNTGDYQTLSSNSGPAHQIIPGLMLGTTIDDEPNGQPSTLADGDDTDEDGITLFGGLSLYQGLSFSLPFNYINTTGSTAYVEAWIDWDGDGSFDGPDEMVADWDDGTSVFPNQMGLTVPVNATLTTAIGFRVRISLQDGMTPYGEVGSGEVEDYLLTVDCPAPICSPVIVTKE